ncbi:MAG: SBBP repeat-containing protein [Bdellovibrionota bacterium]
MVITEDDSVIVAGQTFGSFGEANARSKDAFIAKFDANGNYKWIRQLGIVSLGNKALGDEIVNALALDSKGNILIAGSTTGDLGEANSGVAMHLLLNSTFKDISFGLAN